MQRGWEVNSSAAAAGPALAPAALSRLWTAALGLASAAAETWQTQPTCLVHQVSPRNPRSVPLSPILLLQVLAWPDLGVGDTAQPRGDLF